MFKEIWEDLFFADLNEPVERFTRHVVAEYLRRSNFTVSRTM